MIEASIESHAYAIYAALIACVAAFTLVVGTLKSDELPSKVIKLFRLYFIIGLIGWLLQAAQHLSALPLDLTFSSIGYIACSFLLLWAITECAEQKISILPIGIAHMVFAVVLAFEADDTQIINFISGYAFITYAVISAVAIRSAIRNDNIGQGIIGTAAFFACVGAAFQLYYALIEHQPVAAYNIAFATSAVGYLLVGIGFLSSVLLNEHKKLVKMALNDPLTGLLNRRGMDYSMLSLTGLSKRNAMRISVIAIDIDHFKKINDTYGHDGGDIVLKHVANLLSSVSRESDIVCRLGGEEFVILLPDTELHRTVEIAERLRGYLQGTPVPVSDESVQITASFGVATQQDNQDIDDLLKQADKALYQAKNLGRNRVVQADPT